MKQKKLLLFGFGGSLGALSGVRKLSYTAPDASVNCVMVGGAF